jgi:L-threonylcarbamoyladenylate synthase
MEIIQISEKKEKIVAKAVEVLKGGGLVVYPTETCYGIGADATNKKAVEKLLAYKARREGKPFSVVMAEKAMAKEYIELNDMAENIYDNYLPGPLTVVSKSLGGVVKEVESESGTLGVRVPAYPLVLEISKVFGKPFTATSANMSYDPKPYSVEALLKDLPEKKKKLIDLIIDGGKLPKNEASTVVDTTLNTMNVLREGKVSFKKSLKEKNAELSAYTYNAEETVAFGTTAMLRYLDDLRENCVVFLLSGELGTGKTQFAKGIGRQLKIKKLIKSPTYNILNEYDYKLGEKVGKLVHIDTWKVYSWDELKSVGFTNYIQKQNVLAIEWGEKFFEELEGFLKKKKVKIYKVNFEYVGENERFVTIFR